MGYEKILTNRLFRGLFAQQVRRLYEAGASFPVERGETIIRQGHVQTDLYVVLSGELEVSLWREDDGSEMRLAAVHPGDCFGEYGLVDRKPASATVIAVRDGELFRISVTEFDNLLDSDPHMASVIYKNLLTYLVQRLRSGNIILELLRPK